MTPSSHQKATVRSALPSQSEIAEVVQAITLAVDPCAELIALKSKGVLEKVIPEFAACWGPKGEQEAEWHPEGNVWEHTLMVLKNAEANDRLVKLAATFHDIGKPLVFNRRIDTGRISSTGHEYAGANLFEDQIGPRLGLDKKTIEDVSWLCRFHMLPQFLKIKEAVSDQTLSYIVNHPLARQLIALHKADANGAAIEPFRRRDNSDLLTRLVQQAEAKS